MARLGLNIALREILTRRPQLKWDSSVPLDRHPGIVRRPTRAVFQMG